ncbi:restriction endonuclease [Collinsella sp. AM41-2BH]|nr:restriction endonuclease [Collinsella aerofaciens]RGL43030.1 restriction endonuclease [Collinsella sp. TF06-6AC]RHB15958.1 restriction endonuclease [Collinsella sp. AM41-2BH]
MIRAGRGGVYASDWLEHGVIGIGWDFDGADIAAMNREQIRAAYGLSHPGDSKGRVAAGVGQVYRFAHDMTTDSTVVMYDPESRLYHLGVITGPCVAVCDMDGVTYTRDVKWGETAPRDVLSPSSKNSLGGIQTIFAVSDEVMADLTNAARDKSVVASNDPAIDDNDATNDEETLAATYDNGIELIKDRVNQLDWEDMERLVAGLLKAMGYCARVMPKGPDGGRDVVASPDALGLESPRIVAEVKHRKGAMGAPAVRAFIGGLRAGDRGLYVSTGGFTKEARYEADRANIPVRLLDLDAFVRHYVEIYDKTDDDTRSILPLTRIWWPA